MSQVLVTAAGIYGALVFLMFVFQRSLLYHPDTQLPQLEDYDAAAMEVVGYPTDDGLELQSWFKAPEGGYPTIVYFQGNAGHWGDRVYKAKHYMERGFGVLLAGYRGYGGNPGSPSEDGLFSDGRAALAFLRGRGIQSGRTVLYGESLGSGVAVHLAFEQAEASPVAAVVLEAPYTSIAAVAQSHYPFLPARWLVRDRFDSKAKIKNIKAPLLIFHGRRDRTIPMRFGQALFDSAIEPKKSHWIDGAAHNDLYDYRVEGLVMKFLDKHLINKDKSK